jgi:hypothetical protein
MWPAEPTRIRQLAGDTDRRLVLALDEMRRALPSADQLQGIERSLATSIDRAEAGVARAEPADEAEDSGVRHRAPRADTGLAAQGPRPPRSLARSSALGAALLLAAAAAVAFVTRDAARPATSEPIRAAAESGPPRARAPQPALPVDQREAARSAPLAGQSGETSERAGTERPAPARPGNWRSRARGSRASTAVWSPGKPPQAAVGVALETGESGRVNINSIPIAAVVLDGRPLGGTPRVGVTVAAGEHTVLFVHPNRGRKSVQVNVGPGGTVLAAVRF